MGIIGTYVYKFLLILYCRSRTKLYDRFTCTFYFLSSIFSNLLKSIWLDILNKLTCQFYVRQNLEYGYKRFTILSNAGFKLSEGRFPPLPILCSPRNRDDNPPNFEQIGLYIKRLTKDCFIFKSNQVRKRCSDGCTIQHFVT